MRKRGYFGIVPTLLLSDSLSSLEQKIIASLRQRINLAFHLQLSQTSPSWHVHSMLLDVLCTKLYVDCRTGSGSKLKSSHLNVCVLGLQRSLCMTLLKLLLLLCNCIYSSHLKAKSKRSQNKSQLHSIPRPVSVFSAYSLHLISKKRRLSTYQIYRMMCSKMCCITTTCTLKTSEERRLTGSTGH